MDKYGADIVDKQTQYFDLKVADPRAARGFLDQHSELKRYWDEKRILDEAANKTIVDLALQMPEGGDQMLIQKNYEPKNMTQEHIVQIASGAKPLTWEDFSGFASPNEQQAVLDYWVNDQPLTPQAKSELDYLAPYNGYQEGADLLRAVGIAIRREGISG
jgi:hypothetical protein